MKQYKIQNRSQNNSHSCVPLKENKIKIKNFKTYRYNAEDRYLCVVVHKYIHVLYYYSAGKVLNLSTLCGEIRQTLDAKNAPVILGE